MTRPLLALLAGLLLVAAAAAADAKKVAIRWHGQSMFEIVTPAGDERRVVFRQHRSNAFKDHDAGVAAKEYGVLKALHRSGLAVPEPFGCDEGEVDGPYLVMEWIDGSTELAAGELPGALDQMARFLVAVHGLDARSLDVPYLAPIEDPVEGVIAHLPPTTTVAHARYVDELDPDGIRVVLGRLEQKAGIARDSLFEPPLPDETFERDLTLAVGDSELRLEHAPGHAASMLTVYEPASATLWAADVLSDIEIPAIVDDLTGLREHAHADCLARDRDARRELSRACAGQTHRYPGAPAPACPSGRRGAA